MTVETGKGGLMGDPCTVRLFTGTVRRPLRTWLDEIPPAHTESLSAAWGPFHADLALWKYANDLWQFDVLPEAVPEACRISEFVQSLAHSDEVLNRDRKPGTSQSRSLCPRVISLTIQAVRAPPEIIS